MKEIEVDRLLGQPADIASSAYEFRADRKPEENPPETDFLFSALAHKRLGVLCGLLWEEPRPVKQVVLHWSGTEKAIPQPDQLVLYWFPEGGSASWWCRAGAGATRCQADQPAVSVDGRFFTYTLDALSNDAAIDNLVIAAKDSVNLTNPLPVPSIQVLAAQVWQRLDVFIEWGFEDGTKNLAFDGSIEAYNGIVGKVAALTGDKGTQMTQADTWQSRPNPSNRRGITAQLLYLGYQDTPVWPGQANIEDVNRTIVTVRTKSGSFSFLPADLDKGPILAPEYGFFVAKAGELITAATFRKELARQRRKNLAPGNPRPTGAKLGKRDACGTRGRERRFPTVFSTKGKRSDGGRGAAGADDGGMESWGDRHAPQWEQG